MKCKACAQIKGEIKQRLRLLAKMGEPVERLAALSGKVSISKLEELAGLIMLQHIAKGELDGLKIALGFHQGSHRVQ